MADQDGVPEPTNVIAALARVTAEVGGIEKKKGGEGGISYKFRGIDAIAQAAQPLLGRYGVVMVPHLSHHVVDEITINGKPWTDTSVTVDWAIYGPGGRDDMIWSRTIGLGRDNSDKGYNKAMTGAYKNLLLRLLCIGDPSDDTDGHTHERDRSNGYVPSARAVAAYDRMPHLSDAAKENLKALALEYGHKLTTRDMDADETWLVVVEAVIQQDVVMSDDKRAELAQQKLADAGLSGEPDSGSDEDPEAERGYGV